MMRYAVPVWKKAPFLRLLLPIAAGILLQWSFNIDLKFIILSAVLFSAICIAFFLLPLSLLYKLRVIHGIVLNFLLIVCGSFVTWQKDIRNDPKWFGKIYHDSDQLIISISEPLIKKNRSYKAGAEIVNIISRDSLSGARGRIIIYFEKDSLPPALKYGDRIIFNKRLQAIRNTGNPGAFDYRQYSAFHGIFHTVYLEKKDWILIPAGHAPSLQQFLFTARENILHVLRKNLRGNDDQLAIAEALLIGYTQDLDKDLVQAYSNTGVVHIIAISGMHLGLIYVMLLWIFKTIPGLKRLKFLKFVIIIAALWLFALLTGGSASILRAAVMFTCIIIGENLKRRSSIYNSLAASAFLLLCYNPYFLWDVGFQLSYLAVAGIIIFQKPVFNLWYFKNRLLGKIWQLTSVTLAAQLLTFPVCLFYFHQFPTLFLFTNILLVPLSGIILFAEIFMVALAGLPWISFYLGKITWYLIWLMNAIIGWFNELSFSVWDGISMPLFSTLVLYALVSATALWLFYKNKTAFFFSLFMLVIFSMASLFAGWHTALQQKLIVYNIPRHRSIDFVKGRYYSFVGDDEVSGDAMLQNFHLRPSRIALHTSEMKGRDMVTRSEKGMYFINERKILVIDRAVNYQSTLKINVDIIIISGNPKLSIPQLVSVFNCSQFVFDSSNNLWKIAKWKKDCEQLHLRCYSVPDQGAFVFDL
jgi:competence protein ComEC